jgi:hypothetical protein
MDPGPVRSGLASRGNLVVPDQLHPAEPMVLLAAGHPLAAAPVCARPFGSMHVIPYPLALLQALWDQGYSAADIISILFRVVRNQNSMHEFMKLEYIKVRGGSKRAQMLGWAWMLGRRLPGMNRGEALRCAGACGAGRRAWLVRGRVALTASHGPCLAKALLGAPGTTMPGSRVCAATAAQQWQ